MSIFIGEIDSDLRIEVLNIKGEVFLAYNGHRFVRCYTEDGIHYVELVDADYGIVEDRHPIMALCRKTVS